MRKAGDSLVVEHLHRMDKALGSVTRNKMWIPKEQASNHNSVLQKYEHSTAAGNPRSQPHNSCGENPLSDMTSIKLKSLGISGVGQWKAGGEEEAAR